MTALEHFVFLILVSLLSSGEPNVDAIETNGPEVFHMVSSHRSPGVNAVDIYCVKSRGLANQMLVIRTMFNTAPRYDDVRYVQRDGMACLKAVKAGALDRDGDTWRFFDNKEQLMVGTMVEQSGFGTWDIPWETGYHLTLPLPTPPE